MGYEVPTLEKLINTIKIVFPTTDGLTMLEFGNQEVYGYEPYVRMLDYFKTFGYNGSSNILKYFFEFLKIEHTAIDYNGNDGALPYDVREPLKHKLPKFNVITNVGFSEHVGESCNIDSLIPGQYAFFKNIHDLGDIDTLYYHCVPLTRNWYKHGVCDYSLEFFNELCSVNNYKIIDGPFIETYHPEKQASIFYTKTNNADFITLEQFSRLPGLRLTFKD